MRRIVFSSLLVACSSTIAQVVAPPLTPQEAFDSGKEFGNTQSPNTQDAFNYAKSKGVKGFSGTGTKPGEALGPNYSDSTAPESSYVSATGMSIMNTGGTDRIAECYALPASASYEKKIECESVKYLAGYVDNKPIIDRTTDPLLVGAKQVVTTAKSETKNTEVPCSPTVNTGTDTVTQEVCQEMRPAYERTCGETLTVNCYQPPGYCNEGGIQANTIQGDINFFVTPMGDSSLRLDVGTTGDNYWGTGWYDRSITFWVEDKSRVALFTLDSVAFDDWVWIKLNGQTVYIGPYGGQYLEYGTSCSLVDPEGSSQMSCTPVSWMVEYAPGMQAKAELSTSWNIGLGISAKDKLITGTNTMWVRTVVAGNGEFFSKWTVATYCKVQCKDSWDDACAPYRAIQATPPAPFNQNKANTCFNTQTGTWATCVN